MGSEVSSMLNSPMAQSVQTDIIFNAEEAKDDISDLMTQIEGHDMWVKEQLTSTEARLKAYQRCGKQADRLKQMLNNSVDEMPTEQQYRLICEWKDDFLKSV